MGLLRYGNVLVFPRIYIAVLFIHFSFSRVTNRMFIRNKYSISVSIKILSIRINNNRIIIINRFIKYNSYVHTNKTN